MKAIAESYGGFTSNTSPCSGFVTVDDDGTPCAGFRQCGSITGLKGHNKWDVPLEIRCAKNDNLTEWGDPEYLFPVYFNRGLPYDPTRPWKDTDGNWYATISMDGCNATSRNCPAGGDLRMWKSPKLHGAGADWQYVGPMVTTARTPLDSSATHEFVTSDYFGNITGDPRGGKTRVVINNDCNHGATNMGTPIFYVGVQENGGPFLDASGKMDFQGPGEIGMLDWGAYSPKPTDDAVINGKGNANGNATAVGLAALEGGKPRGYSMARTLGSDPNQVAKAGRRVSVAWVSAALTSQSLLQDITLGPDNALRQAFVPELEMLREGDAVPITTSSVNAGQQFELLATVTGSKGKAGVVVLASGTSDSGASSTIPPAGGTATTRH